MPIISVEHLSKRYLVGHREERDQHGFTALREVLGREIRNIARKTVDVVSGRPVMQGDFFQEYWALRDVSFEVAEGEVLGIIGRNGAGKSTLLKVLSRITEPTAGRVTLRGRVASLLEVGTGFHPELSGRENIYLNGAILGMSRAEIRRKFDEIVDFADIDKFLDTPVKRYSSGMYVRLAFAVAAHLEPEILIIDEVLAVGDAAFQKKCLGKMSEVAGDGRTVLFVSHNLNAIETLCTRSLLLASGMLVGYGDTAEIVTAYRETYRTQISGQPKRVQDGLVLEHVTVSPSTVEATASIKLQLDFTASAPGRLNECAVLFYTSRDERIAIVDIRESGSAALPFLYTKGKFAIHVEVSSVPFVEGDFRIGLYLVTGNFRGNLLDLTAFTVTPPRTTDNFIMYPAESRGLVVLNAATSFLSRDVYDAERLNGLSAQACHCL